MIKNAKWLWDPASSFLGLSAATVAGRFWPSARGALDVLYVMSTPPVVTAGRFAGCRICWLRGRRARCGCARRDGDAKIKAANGRRSAIGFPIARPSARRTCRVAGLTRIFGQAAGGRPAERLMASLGRTVGNGSDAGLFIHRCSRSTQRRGNTSGWSMRRCQEPFWCENLKIFTAIAINSENFVLRNSHY